MYTYIGVKSCGLRSRDFEYVSTFYEFPFTHQIASIYNIQHTVSPVATTTWHSILYCADVNVLLLNFVTRTNVCVYTDLSTLHIHICTT